MSIQENIQHQARLWLSKESEGENLQTDSTFFAWIACDARHHEAFQDEKKLLQEVHALPQAFLDDLKREVRQTREVRNTKPLFLRYVAPLAVAACTLCVVYFTLFYDHITFSEQYVATTKVHNDIFLPDTSKIALDANTSIDVTYFKSKRLVKLSRGKAIFDVFPNQTAPFIIQTDRVNIKVLGTKFEVINFENILQVNVQEGKVEVSARDQNDKPIAFVTKGESLSFNPVTQRIDLQKINAQKVGEWQQGKYTFYQASLKEVFNEFAKHLDITVYLDTRVASLPISGNFDVHRLDAFLDALPLIHPVMIEKSATKIVIK
ncbi:FecR family protein [Sulfurospirillum halorespirans]|uniref:Sigma factor regulatory membrane protein FecR-like n=1 Tax=Sulfurospirillum halorespirans DSM 13726 TaxID=1193502 RepID=A0A1D7TID9_9BACT|nr:FecR domain-containing protein [Sulfurospirillum halorespirans]AOO64743.1 sigma factor regulatory membrane protein FecR-like [Sulfurospirillum halorespirans DSM 13726]